MNALPNPKGASTPHTRDRILEAAKRLFAEHGYDNTATVAIVRAAGTSESQLMRLFGGKEALLEAILDEGWKAMAPIFRAIHDLHSPAEKLEAILELMLRALDRDPELRDLLLLEGRRIRREGHMILLTGGYLQFIGVIDAILAEMRTRGELRNDVHNDAVRSALVSMFEGMLRDRVLAARMNFPADYDQQEMRQIFRIVLAAFSPVR